MYASYVSGFSKFGPCIKMYCIIFAFRLTSGTIMGDECDWTGSGLTTPSEDRGVTPVYLRCTAGKVSWLYPRGALRVLLRLPTPDRDFRACIKLHPDGGKRLPVRLFLEGPRSLHQLYSHEEERPKAVRCFQSKNGLAAIYVESIDNDSVTKRVVEISYDLQPLPKGSRVYDAFEECRPCTYEELAHAFCTSDLVTRGIIKGVENSEELQVTQLSIKVTKMIRQTSSDSDTEIESNLISDPEKEVLVHVAQHCGVKHGVGEFVIMARRKLGDLTLQCAPRLEDWTTLMNMLSEEGKVQCILKS